MYRYDEAQYTPIPTRYLTGLRTVHYQPKPRVLRTTALRTRNRARNRQGLCTKGSKTIVRCTRSQKPLVQDLLFALCTAAAHRPIHVQPLPSPKQRTLRHCRPTN
jgi:hypothetical protein